jgi:hypothetical protein
MAAASAVAVAAASEEAVDDVERAFQVRSDEMLMVTGGSGCIVIGYARFITTT